MENMKEVRCIVNKGNVEHINNYKEDK